mgnify:CR=1 FL=1|jgi:hypothetical protein
MRKSLQQKLSRKFKAEPLELIVHGLNGNEWLESSSLSVGFLSKKIKNNIESAKATANLLGLYSLAANQVALEHSFFIIASKLKDGIWMDRNLSKALDYDVYINPIILGVSPVRICMPYYIIVSFKNMAGNIVPVSQILEPT